MARGTTLANLRQMLKAEIGAGLDESVQGAGDAALNLLLANQQKWLLGQLGFVLGKVRVDLELTAGTRYYTFPETTIDIDRVDPEVWVTWDEDSIRRRVEFGITQEHFQAWDSEADEKLDWVRRWDLVNVNGTLKLEVWPIPQSDQTLKFSGYMPLPRLTQEADVCAVDDLVLVLFTAAEWLARDKKSDATAKLSKAQALLTSLKGSRQSQFERFNWNSRGRERRGLGITGSSIVRQRQGSQALAAGVTEGTITLALNWNPTAVELTLQIPAGGQLIMVYPQGAPTNLGFSFYLDSPTPNGNYVLTYTIW